MSERAVGLGIINAGREYYLFGKTKARIPSLLNQQLTDWQSAAVVELQNIDCCLSDFSKRSDDWPLKSKMLAPFVGSRIVESNKIAFWVNNAANVCAFMNIAEWARIGEIIEIAGSAVFEANDMVNLIRRIHIIFMNQAVLTNKSRSDSDTFPEFIRHIFRHSEPLRALWLLPETSSIQYGCTWQAHPARHQ